MTIAVAVIAFIAGRAVGILVMALVTISGRDDRDPRRTL